MITENTRNYVERSRHDRYSRAGSSSGSGSGEKVNLSIRSSSGIIITGEEEPSFLFTYGDF
jgi:hypothetical protein